MTFTNAIVNVDGIQVFAQREYTAGAVLNSFEANMKIVQDFMALKSPPPADYDFTILKIAIENLRDLAVNGIDCPLNSSNPNGDKKTFYLTIEMNESLDLLFRSLNSAGIAINKTGDIDVSENPLWFQKWYDLGAGTSLLQNVFIKALSAKEHNFSLQSMIELQYIKWANDLLGEKMKDLQGAIQLTKDSLALLTDLQNLHNQIQVQNRPPFSTFYDLYSKHPNFFPEYQTAASAYYGTPLIPTLVNDGWQITPELGFLNYISNVAEGAMFGKNGDNFTVTLPPEINKLVPNDFLEKYNLKLKGVTPKGDYIYETSNQLLQRDEKLMHNSVAGYYRIVYASAIAPGATFKGVTIPEGLSLDSLGGSGSSYLSNIMSETFKLNRSPELLKEVQSLVKYRNTISAQIAALHAENPPAPGKDVDSNSLEGRLQSILDDINRVFVTADSKPITSATSLTDAYNGFKTWMLDQYDQPKGENSNSAGAFQQHITNAITAGQALNDTQKENVRQFLFIFEEFYKSASALLQAITQIIERIAQGVGRS